jgi:hypothetical protein
MAFQTQTTASGKSVVVVSRYKFDMGIRVFVAMLNLLIMAEIIYHVSSSLVYLLVLPFLISLVPLLTSDKLELDFGRKRYRLYRFRWLVGRYGYKDLPPLDHILLRDIILTGGFTDSRTPIGETYGYELSLVDTGHEKLVVCIRYSEHRVQDIAQVLQSASGLRTVDSTKERILGQMTQAFPPLPPEAT